jgi:hypothetical protein
MASVQLPVFCGPVVCLLHGRTSFAEHGVSYSSTNQASISRSLSKGGGVSFCPTLHPFPAETSRRQPFLCPRYDERRAMAISIQGFVLLELFAHINCGANTNAEMFVTRCLVTHSHFCSVLSAGSSCNHTMETCPWESRSCQCNRHNIWSTTSVSLPRTKLQNSRMKCWI